MRKAATSVIILGIYLAIIFTGIHFGYGHFIYTYIAPVSWAVILIVLFILVW